jgi:hypothetical protein
MHHIFILPLSTDGHLGDFDFVATLNTAAINTRMQMSLGHTDFISSGYIQY